MNDCCDIEGFAGHVDIDAAKVANDTISNIIDMYAVNFKLKDESADDFVGMNVYEDGVNVQLSPISYVNLGAADFGICRYRYKHYLSNGFEHKKVSIVLSQIFSFVDRTSSYQHLVRVLVKLLVEFRAVGYPHVVLLAALKKFHAKYPFIDAVPRAWAHELHREDIFWRRSFHKRR